MLDFNEMMVFAKVAEALSLTRAAEQLNMPKSTISRKLSSLEDRLGVRLLQRSTRALQLTEAGGLLLEHCLRMQAEAEEAHLSLSEMQREPKGVLKVSAPYAFGSRFTSEMLSGYLALYPQVEIELDLSYRYVDLIKEGVDVAFRVGKGLLADSSLIARGLGTSNAYVMASPNYLRAHGTPTSPYDLKEHFCVSFDALGFCWQDEEGLHEAEIQRKISVNDIIFARQLALDHCGITCLPGMHCGPDIETGRLQPILTDWHFPGRDLFLVYPSKKRMSTKLKSFVDYVMDYSLPDPPWQRPVEYYLSRLASGIRDDCPA